jgi:L-asparaginase / beta-aspartyl-peptidase
MNRLRWVLALGVALTIAAALPSEPARAPEKAVLVIHGGAGIEDDVKTTPDLEKRYRADLEKALRAGHAALQKDGGTSLDAVEAAIRVLEDSTLFNAGRGAVFTREGRNELDASIMEGKNKRAGAVAGVTRTRSPIAAARAVMEKSGHVLMVGDGADRFARSQGLPEVSPLYFWTERRWKELLEAKKEAEKSKSEGTGAAGSPQKHFGTVGAAALDRAGNLAAGTSTGGLTYKRSGRVGDSPIIGAGTYADNEACAVSCTGYGEVFIRHSVAHEVTARMKYQKLSVRDAADKVLQSLPKPKDGVGGLIALDREGNFALTYNTDGMFRGFITADGTVHVAIWEK